jgi:transcriptional regulator with XRE-family HTH domain
MQLPVLLSCFCPQETRVSKYWKTGGTQMELSEKILNLRKANNLTQEQLAEEAGVTRQAVSKWESGQSVPELDKIIALCEIFHITTDSLLKPSELDVLSAKTQMLENQQKNLENAIKKKEQKKRTILGCTAIYLIAFSILMLVRQLSHMNDFFWDLFPGITLPVFLFCIATAAAVILYRHSL